MRYTGRILLSAGSLALLAAVAGAQPPVRTESPGQVVMMPTYATLVASVNAAGEAVTKIDNLAGLTADQVRLVDAHELVSDANQSEFDAAVEKNAASLTALRTSLQKNDIIAKAIAEHPGKPAIDDVVAADVGPDNELTIYFRKKG